MKVEISVSEMVQVFKEIQEQPEKILGWSEWIYPGQWEDI